MTAAKNVRQLETERVLLRPLEREDLESRVSWINDPETSSLLMFDYPTSVAKTEEWFRRTLFDRSKLNLSIINRKTGQLIGMTGLLDIDLRHSRAQMYITIGELSERGKGLAREIIPLNLDFAFSEIGLNRVYLYTLESNARARSVYESIGFRAEGILKEHHRGPLGVENLHVHSVLASDWVN